MADFETRLARAKHLVTNEHTLRYLHEMRVTPVRQSTIDALACVACRQARGLEASADEIEEADCTTARVVQDTGRKLSALGIILRTKVDRVPCSTGGKPRYNLSLADSVPPEVRVELRSNRPCKKQA